jgi:hypothetical protein
VSELAAKERLPMNGLFSLMTSVGKSCATKDSVHRKRCTVTIPTAMVAKRTIEEGNEHV